MTNGNKLFRWRDPYDAAGTQALFAAAMAENARFQAGHCPDYARIFSQTDGADLSDFLPREIITDVQQKMDSRRDG